MKKYLKTALNINQIETINSNKEDIDGVELHLMRFEDDLSLIGLIQVPIFSIHYYLYHTEPDVNPCDIDRIINDIYELDRFKKLVDVAKENGSCITLHLATTMDTFNEDGYKKFIEIVREGSVILNIENVPDGVHVKNSEYLISQIPSICKKMNDDIGEELCFPLLDICHAMMTINSTVDPVKTLAKYIEEFSSDHFCIHLSEAVSDGLSFNHGKNFTNNKKYLFLILDMLYKTNKDTHIIIEVNDIDFIKKDDSLGLLKYIKEWNC